MNPQRRFLNLAIAGALLLGGALSFTGCAGGKLESGGSYAPIDASGAATVEPDMPFYVADAAYKTAWSAVNAAFEFERDNRLTLWQLSPNIKHTLDVIRPQAVAANHDYLAARAAYMANPTPTGLTTLQQVLSKMQALVAAAQAALPTQTTTK